tara:strand:+ start:394 stop:1029 length:636 start_codon:yes stop_codon:yes gene_type:complete
MTQRNITLKLLDTNTKISKDINEAIAKELNKRIRKRRRRAINQLRSLTFGWVLEQPELQDISKGGQNSLAAQFGIPEGSEEQVANAIALAVRSSLIINFNTVNNSLKGKIDFAIQPSDFGNLLSLPEGVVSTDIGQLPWLEWLLIRGSTVIVNGYQYQPSSDGRSGGGWMVSGGSWRVPPEYAGLPEDNFITRALSNRDKEIESILKGLIV